MKVFQYAGIETGDAWAGGLSRAVTGQTLMTGEAGQEWAVSPGRTLTSGGEFGAGSMSKLCKNMQQILDLDWSM